MSRLGFNFPEAELTSSVLFFVCLVFSFCVALAIGRHPLFEFLSRTYWSAAVLAFTNVSLFVGLLMLHRSDESSAVDSGRVRSAGLRDSTAEISSRCALLIPAMSSWIATGLRFQCVENTNSAVAEVAESRPATDRTQIRLPVRVEKPRSFGGSDPAVYVVASIVACLWYLMSIPMARRAQIDAFWMSLDDDRKREVETAAFQSANSLWVQGYSRAQETGQEAMAAVYRQTILDKHLTQEMKKLAGKASAA